MTAFIEGLVLVAVITLSRDNQEKGMKILTAILIVLALQGCAAMDKHRMERATEMMEMRISVYKYTCSNMGFQTESEIAACALELEIAHQSRPVTKVTNHTTTNGGNGGMSWMCKTAIATNDSGGTMTFCQ